MSDLILVEKINAVELFTQEGVDPLLAKIKEEVRKFRPNMSTAAGRKEIASMAHKVAKSKTYLDDLGKNLVAEWKNKAKVVDDSRKKIRDELDALKEEVRKPLTEWEQKEEARIHDRKTGIDHLRSFGLENYESSFQAKKKLEELTAITVGQEWEEFEIDAKLAKSESLNTLTNIISKLEKYEEEQQELKRLREESAKRDQEERERRIAEEAAMRARIEAENKAKFEAEKIEREKQLAIERQKQAEEMARFSEKRRIEEARIAEEEKKIAEQRAIEQERQRVQAQKEREELEQRKREADIEHKKKINQDILKSLLDFGLTESQAKNVITAIAQGRIGNVSIKY